MGDKIPYPPKLITGARIQSMYRAVENPAALKNSATSSALIDDEDEEAAIATETDGVTWDDFFKTLDEARGTESSTSTSGAGSLSWDQFFKELQTAVVSSSNSSSSNSSSTSNLTSSSGPRGRRNNNWGNIRRSKDQWQGKTGDDGDFVIFDTPESGVRASRILVTNYINNGYNTIQKIISRWAPAADNNNTNGYIQRVVQRSGIDKDRVITANDMDAIKKILTAMYEVELGQTLSADDLAVVDRGMLL